MRGNLNVIGSQKFRGSGTIGKYGLAVVGVAKLEELHHFGGRL